MSKNAIRTVRILTVLALAVILLYTALSPRWAARPEDVTVSAPTPLPTYVPTPTPEATPTPDITATPTASPTPTPEPTATPEPTPITYTISMVGDCTLSSYPEARYYANSFENVVGTNWAYPFSNTLDVFENDDMTIVNLECSISDIEAYSASTFSFLASAETVNVLTLGSVEFATTANNHAMDFGQEVYDDTAANLDAAGIGHCGDGEGVLYTTGSGLTVGVYACYNNHTPSPDAVAEGVRALKDAGAEIVVVSAHWGNEASYYQNANQEEVAHAAIDAGASIVFGHGPHRLEPLEKYNDGIIFYSVGNFIFGGNTNPADMDSVIAQATVTRDPDGSVYLSSFNVLPCSISSKESENDYCPTLFEEGTEEYDRAMSKVDGSWTGANNVIDYSFMHTDESEG